MKQLLFCLVIVLTATSAAFAQPNKKVGPALTKFLNTEFMVKYRDLRISAESAALNVQSNEAGLQASDLFRLRSAYDQTATRANQLLDNIKQDFLNPKKLKTISDFPEMYSDGLRYKLQELADFYSANFQQALADASVAKEDVDGGAVLLLVVELIGLTKGLTNYFADIRREARQYTESYLQEHLVQPYRWRYWDELAGSVSPYEKFENTTSLEPVMAPGTDPLDERFQSLNQTLQTVSSPNDDWSGDAGFDPPAEGALPADSVSTLRYDDWSPIAKPADSGNPNPARARTPKPMDAQPADKVPAAKPKTTGPKNF